MLRRIAAAALCIAGLYLFAQSADAAKLTAERCEKNVVIKIDGKLFAKYLTDNGPKPIVWPIIGPTGKPMTRAYPMVPEAGPHERKDHIHHRSLYFTHDDINGVRFWCEQKGDHGWVKHREYLKVDEKDNKVVVATLNDWLAPGKDGKPGKRVCQDERTLTFFVDGDTRIIDFDIVMKATDGPVRFGDTKEGTMGIRVAGTMKETAKLGGKIVNSEGQTSSDAWGKQAAWVDYHGPVDGETVGIAILNHPSSFRFPTYWHVRTYGLFTANPFGLKNFNKGSEQDGAYTIPAGKSLELRYRFLFHKGDEKAGKVAEAFKVYAKEKK